VLPALAMLAVGLAFLLSKGAPPEPKSDTSGPSAQAALRQQLEPLLLELQDQVRLDFAAEFPYALRDDLKEELALSLEALVLEAYFLR
jgi:hypothetical protein